jgi:RNA polymerase sigma factor (sigma-70 family)
MAISDENQLIQKIIKGDTVAFSFLVGRYQNLAFQIAFRITQSRETAEEVAQDAFVKAYRSLAGFKQEAKFSTWLYRIVYTTAISRMRRVQLPTQTLETGEETATVNIADTQEQVKQLIAADRHFYLAAALATLPATDQLLVSLYYEHEHNVEEIFRVTGLTPANIKVNLLRARQKLYTALSQSLNKELKEIL